MTIGPAFLDSAVVIYAVGTDHPYRDSCRTLYDAVLGSRFPEAAISVLIVQEVMHQRTRRTGRRADATQMGRDLTTVIRTHDVVSRDLSLATRFFGEVEDLDAADALHAAVAVNHGIPTIVSPDRAFEHVTGLTRLDPIDAAVLIA